MVKYRSDITHYENQGVAGATLRLDRWHWRGPCDARWVDDGRNAEICM